MNVLNKVGYDPRISITVDHKGTKADPRPPRDPAAVCDYFAWLGYLEDEGAFAHREMSALLADPDGFFAKSHAGA